MKNRMCLRIRWKVKFLCNITIFGNNFKRAIVPCCQFVVDPSRKGFLPMGTQFKKKSFSQLKWHWSPLFGSMFLPLFLFLDRLYFSWKVSALCNKSIATGFSSIL